MSSVLEAFSAVNKGLQYANTIAKSATQIQKEVTKTYNDVSNAVKETKKTYDKLKDNLDTRTKEVTDIAEQARKGLKTGGEIDVTILDKIIKNKKNKNYEEINYTYKYLKYKKKYLNYKNKVTL